MKARRTPKTLHPIDVVKSLERLSQYDRMGGSPLRGRSGSHKRSKVGDVERKLQSELQRKIAKREK